MQIFKNKNIIIIVVFILAVLPLLYFGKDAIISTHDNLDILIPSYKMLKENNLLLALDKSAPAFNGMSTAYYTFATLDLLTFLNLFFDIFTAHIIAYILKIILGYFSMYLFLKECVLENNEDNINIIKLVSIAFAILPVTPALWITVETVPLVCYFFCKIAKKDEKYNKKVWLLFFYPVLSKFATTGLFLLSLWFLAMIIIFIKNRKINLNLIYGLLALTAGYIIVDFKLFYVKLILQTPLNRDIYDMVLANATYTSLSKTIYVIAKDFLNGSYHAPSLSTFIILIIFISIIYSFFRRKDLDKNKKIFNYFNNFNFMLASLLVGLFFSSLVGLKLNQSIYLFFKEEFPFLKSFNTWDRFAFLNRTIFYVAFAVALVNLKDLKVFKKKNIVFFLAIIQIVYVLVFYKGAYNYAAHNLRYNSFIKRNNVLSYREFFSENLFEKIKLDLNYKGEKVAAVGYHPSVLMYNGFTNIDGYMNFYPLSYMLEFRKIITPELEKNDKMRRYFDSWGGRLYFYNSELSYEPTRIKVDKAVDVFIDTNTFKSMGGKYILSRAEIKNYKNLNLSFINSYEDEHSPYRIYVYSL